MILKRRKKYRESLVDPNESAGVCEPAPGLCHSVNHCPEPRFSQMDLKSEVLHMQSWATPILANTNWIMWAIYLSSKF